MTATNELQDRRCTRQSWHWWWTEIAAAYWTIKISHANQWLLKGPKINPNLGQLRFWRNQKRDRERERFFVISLIKDLLLGTRLNRNLTLSAKSNLHRRKLITLQSSDKKSLFECPWANHLAGLKENFIMTKSHPGGHGTEKVYLELEMFNQESVSSENSIANFFVYAN